MYGLRDPSLAFLPTAGHGADFQDGYELTKDPGSGAYLNPPIGCPLPDVEIGCFSGDWAYVWARFNDEPLGAHINGIAVGIDGGSPGPGNIAWYMCDNGKDCAVGPFIRWDGEQSVFYFNPAGLIAVNANGVRNLAGDLPHNLYIGGDCHTFLLGAVKVNCPVDLKFEFGPVPVKYANAPDPDVRVCNRVLPEPAGLVMLGLLALTVRRR